ncbi:MAG: aspartate ammonia-lyase [Candidatus Cloacimonetes bacterium 4572_65]|nr:MAG: aspartate ammonia-lyase [Candidatus Cloacimonetes bacterium 4572_65]
MRTEIDILGSLEIEDSKLYGINTARALDNFKISRLSMSSLFIKSFAEVKLACARTNFQLGYLEDEQFEAIFHACNEIINGNYHDEFQLDALQGGAGTSMNMNMNEVIANIANQYLEEEVGSYKLVKPLEDVNKHQSTNDVYPTAVKITVLYYLKQLEGETALLQEEFQKREKDFHSIIKLGRTQLQDAVPMTLGMEFSAYAEAIARDRWRIFKCRERIKVLNLGGTAIGTGLGAPQKYIFKVVENLKDITGLVIARSENLVETTQNLDQFVEISGMLKTLAVNLLKISSDLRLLASGPDGGFGEINLPAVQSGSTIMPTKVNPVIPEAISQVALKVMGNDSILSSAVAMGNLELNQFMPLIAYTLIESLEILNGGCLIFREKCISGISANAEVCKEKLLRSKTIATVLVPVLGYKKVEELIRLSIESKVSVKDLIIEKNIIDEDRLEELLSPKRMYKLGF